MRKILYIPLLLLLVLVSMSFNYEMSFAEEASTANIRKSTPLAYTCAHQTGEYSQALIRCITNPIKNAVLSPTDGILLELQKFVADYIYPLLTLALLFLGAQVVSGDAYVWPRVISFLIRSGVIISISSGVIQYGTIIFALMDDIINLPFPTAFTPWLAIDELIGKMFGFIKGQDSLKDGLIGLMQGSLFSKGLGIMISLVGCVTLFSLLVFAFNVVYIYIVSFLVVAFLIAILPLVLPLYIFIYSEHMLLRWMDTLISNILTPTFLFLFLSIFLGTPTNPSIFKDPIDKIFTALGPDYMQRCMHDPQPVTPSVMISSETTLRSNLACPAATPNCTDATKDTGAIQSNVDPTSWSDIFFSWGRVSVFDCGLDDAATRKMNFDLFTNLLILLFLTSIMNAMLNQIPPLAKSIGGGATAFGADVSTILSRAIGNLKRS